MRRPLVAHSGLEIAGLRRQLVSAKRTCARSESAAGHDTPPNINAGLPFKVIARTEDVVRRERHSGGVLEFLVQTLLEKV